MSPGARSISYFRMNAPFIFQSKGGNGNTGKKVRIGQLLDIIAVVDSVMPQGMAKSPEIANDVSHLFFYTPFISYQVRPR